MSDESQDAVGLLLAASRRWPLLTAHEEIALAKRVERGDLEARERLINSNIRLVVSIARHSGYRDNAFADRVQDGMLGLIRACEKFDWRRGLRFSTYATVWIRQAIQRGAETQSRTVRLPSYIWHRARKVARAEDLLASELGRRPSTEEVAERVGLPVDEVLRVREASLSLASLDAPIGDEDLTLGAVIPVDEPAPLERAVHNGLAQALMSAMAVLPPAERQVIELRYGAASTLREAGRTVGVSAVRAQQLEARALERLASDPALAAFRHAA